MKLRSIYEYFSEYTEKEIDEMIEELSENDKILLRERFGDDLHQPVSSETFDNKKRTSYYNNLLPKMKLILAKRKIDALKIELSNHVISEDQERIFLELVKEKLTNNEICEKLNIDIEKVNKIILDLKNKGILVSKKYYSDGTVRYRVIKSISDYVKELSKTRTHKEVIITDPKENDIKFLVISDLHFGNSAQRLDLINRAFDYCKKNGINIILCGGDLLDGSTSKSIQYISDGEEQAKFFIENYPYDKDILTFSVAGDHDSNVLNKNLINIIELCKNYRPDVIISGYNNVDIHVKNDTIHLFHSIWNGKIIINNSPIVLHGHSHKYLTDFRRGVLWVTIPTLCNITQSVPSALELSINFKKGYINEANVKHIYFGPSDIVLSESLFDLLKNRNVEYSPIINIEPYKKNCL